MTARPTERGATDGIEVRAASVPVGAALLSPTALAFLGTLHRRFDGRRRELLAARGGFRRAIAAGEIPPLRAPAGQAMWAVAPAPHDLQDRRVEITGPPDRKMIINALNSNASVFMADFEDAHAPTWEATLQGQANLIEAVRRRLRFVTPEGKSYRLVPTPATLVVRPRGLHLPERHLYVDGAPIAGAFFDFGLYLFHNARELVARGTGPYFYLAKLEHASEAALWRDVLAASEQALGLAPGTIRVTVLIETLPAAFEAESILYELREYATGLNCGRWDYIFSFLKQHADRSDVVLPDRSQLTMEAPFLRAYATHLVRVCHRHGAHALGGMAAGIPSRDDPAATEVALARVRADKEREVRLGHDGTWVAHPGLVPVARAVFDAGMPGPNQIRRLPEGEAERAEDLLAVPPGGVSREGVRTNVRVALRYLEAWFRGVGCVPVDRKMEDAATIEIARSLLWQWIQHAVPLDDGRRFTAERFRTVLREESDLLHDELLLRGIAPDPRHRAELLLDRVVTAPGLADFLVLEAYDELDEAAEAPPGPADRALEAPLPAAG
jgi:malate synthase